MPEPAARRLATVLDSLDRLNRADPNTDSDGASAHPREGLYAQRLSAWVKKLRPDASEALQIAARGQHVQRWTIPRQRYEMNRQGYLRWRETLKAFHIETVAAIMREAGYGEPEIARVGRIMNKRHLAEEPESQTLEDALCLVFLEFQFADLRKKTEDGKMREIVRKTWAKMSEQGRKEALDLPLSQDDKNFLREALAG